VPGAKVYPEPPVRVEAVARLGETVEVQITRRYQTARNPEAEFTTTYFYAPTGNSWQLASAPANFWGDPRTTTGTRVVIQHTQRNQKIIDSLIATIDPALTAACDQWHCPTDLAPVTLTFSTTPIPQPDLLVSGDPIPIFDLSTYLVPQYTGIPLTLSANTDYLTYIAANSVRLLAQQLKLAPQLAEDEVHRQNLYSP